MKILKRFCKKRLIPLKNSCGFTLMEVIVAFAVLSISLVMVMQLFSGGLQASRASCDYTRAVVHAKDKMEEMVLEPASGSGTFEDGFTWESEIFPYELEEEVKQDIDAIGLKPMKIIVKITWMNMGNREKSLELESFRIVEKDKDVS
jgi:general secretion pathway protein I